VTTPFEFRPVLFAVFWKSGIALGAALCISRMLRNRSADLRRLVFSTTIVAMFAAAAATPMLPRWTAVTPLWFHFQRPAPAAVAEPSLSSPMVDDATELTTPVSRPMPPPTSTRRIDLTAWLIPLIWFAGAATLLTRFAINLRGLYRLRKASDAVTDAGLLANVARFGRRVRLWRNDEIGAPVTWGMVRPIILVPAGFEELPAESRDAVIRHELAHIQAHDFLMRGLAEIARALIWFQPLVWIVWRQLREEQELACDNCVLAAGGKPSAYAKLLLDWDFRRGMDSLIAVGIAHRSCLKRRLYALLDTDLRRDKIAGAGVAGALFLALAAALPLAAISFTRAVPVRPAPARALQSASPSLLRPPAQLEQAQTAQTPVKAPAPQPVAQSAARPRFDVVSIKPCKPGVTNGVPNGVPVAGGDSSPGRLSTGCGILADTDHVGLIQRAYNRYASGQLTSTKVIPIEGGPDWIHSERFEIDAKADGQPSVLMMEGPMMQTILEDRFKLKIHRETRQGPVYELALGKGSPKLKPLQDGSCTPVVAGSPLPLLPDGQHRCRNMVSPRGKVDIEGGTLSMFAGLLGMVLDRPVIDKTGIASYFEIHLLFSPDDSAEPRPVGADPGASAAARAPDAPGIFQAIPEQLGLRLVPAKGPVDVLVIDHIERPSEN
jgi:bla regulator protein BlaR1